jgi:hypothetical protein
VAHPADAVDVADQLRRIAISASRASSVVFAVNYRQI